ncbi:polar amino acid transport system substrate-binding protein [Inhella inkyongensis]|uniref:Polar amino acid transport system substrate-binding protein n=1 Tax=Inhella inkyongensis TaxID=392593 RepID=A0A840SAH8_9BURK|nr:transporter substrate-binding domain-containing protein [Inhella inkyongensis]MBB5205501.1 polar amino acid transport system substrate-binding protein [Inhella inkyongensis]
MRLLWAILLGVWLPLGVAADEVVIGAEDDWYPYAGVVDGELRGLTPTLVRAAFEQVGVGVRFEVMPYARCMARTKAGQLVACFNTLRHAGLEADYLWHSPAMFRVQSSIYALAASKQTGLRPVDLEGRRVGVTHGYEYGPDFDGNPRIVRVVGLRDENSFRMLLRGRVDYVMAVEANVAVLLARYPELRGRFRAVGAAAVTESYTVFSRSHPEGAKRRAQFETGLNQLIQSGRLAQIEQEWRLEWTAQAQGGSPKSPVSAPTMPPHGQNRTPKRTQTPGRASGAGLRGARLGAGRRHRLDGGPFHRRPGRQWHPAGRCGQ